MKNLNEPLSNHSTLTGSKVLDIRRLHDEEGYNDAQLARQFSVSRKAIYNIVERKTWTDVPTPTTVRGFKDYTVYPDGRVFSKATNAFISPITRSSGPAVRIRTSGGKRTTVPVSNLIERGFKIAA